MVSDKRDLLETISNDQMGFRWDGMDHFIGAEYLLEAQKGRSKDSSSYILLSLSLVSDEESRGTRWKLSLCLKLFVRSTFVRFAKRELKIYLIFQENFSNEKCFVYKFSFYRPDKYFETEIIITIFV